MRPASTRALLRAYQRLRATAAAPGFDADLRFLQAKDLDLSVRLSALLAADALLITAATNPIAASPGAPLSLSAPDQPGEVALVCAGLALLLVSAWLAVRALLIGEEPPVDDAPEQPEALAQRLIAAYCRSIDAQLRLTAQASRLTVAGTLVSAAAWAWILLAKV